MNALNSYGDFPQDPHLVSPKAELGTLEVAHLETNITNKTIVH